MLPQDRAVHEWYRFVLSFPPHLVRDYLRRLGIGNNGIVLDPFCGTGTTLVECKKLGIPHIGVEANPLANFATSVKVDWRPQPQGLVEHAEQVATAVHRELESQGLSDEPGELFKRRPPVVRLRVLPPEANALLLTNSISPLPLHKSLTILAHLDRNHDPRYDSHERLALAKVLVFSASNLRFGPEVGVGKPKEDAAVVAPWLDLVRGMAQDLDLVRNGPSGTSQVFLADARAVDEFLKPESVDVVITSPPYPNEKDYTRTTRLESVILGFVRTKKDLRGMKEHLVRSNTRGVFKSDDDDLGVDSHPEIQRIAREIERRRIALGKTSGFERLYARVTRLYFGGMSRHLAGLRTVLRSGGQLAYVVGDQASYLQVMIRTGQLLADIASGLGYEVVGLDLFRRRLATATGEMLREEVVLLRWPGPKKRRTKKPG